MAKWVSEFASLEALDPMPKRIAKRIEERKASLAAAVAYLDSMGD